MPLCPICCWIPPRPKTPLHATTSPPARPARINSPRSRPPSLLLDSWQAPEVSPYFDQKLAVRFREAQSAPSEGWFQRLRTRLLFNTGRHLRPALAGALVLVLVVGGGSIGIATFQHPHPVQASAVVNDFQLLDKNEQALQQMDQLLRDDAPAAGSGASVSQI